MSTIKDLSQNFKDVVPVQETNLVKIHVTNEETIVEEQIRQLSLISRAGMLTLEEIKMLDILIKNKRLLEEKSTANLDVTPLPNQPTVDELLQIAGSTEDDTSIESSSSQNTVE